MSAKIASRRVPRLKFVTIPEIARARGVSRVAVHYAITTGKLRAYRVAGRREWLIYHRDADRYVAEPIWSRGPVVASAR